MKIRPVENWRVSWRWASMQLAAVAAAIVTYIVATPSILFGIIAFIPRGDLQLPFAIGCGAFVLLLVAATRLLKKVPKVGYDDQEG